MALTKQVYQENVCFDYWYFKDVGFKFELHVCNKCHDISMGVDFRCILWGISKNEAINRLNNSVLEDEGVL